MATIAEEWSNGSISIAVECGKDDANRESCHVHVYKNGRRTSSRFPGKQPDLDSKDADKAEALYYDHLYEIQRVYNDVKEGKYDE